MRQAMVLLEDPSNEPLNELQGIKQHAAAKFGSKNAVVEYLLAKGFRVLSSGSFGIVCSHPSFNGQYVLKVFSDKPYEAFIDYCIANPSNPHLPKIHGRKIPLRTGACMVRIEVLQPLSEHEWHQRFIPSITNCATLYALGKMKLDKAIDMAEFTHQEDFFHTLVDVVKHKPSTAALDLTSHHGNVMLRGQTIVVTDPYAGKEAPFGFARQPLRPGEKDKRDPKRFDRIKRA